LVTCHRSVSDKYDVIESDDYYVSRKKVTSEHVLLTAVVPEWVIQLRAFLRFCFD